MTSAKAEKKVRTAITDAIDELNRILARIDDAKADGLCHIDELCEDLRDCGSTVRQAERCMGDLCNALEADAEGVEDR